MANSCDFTMKMVSPNKKSLMDLKTIMSYKHDTHYMYRVFDFRCDDEDKQEGEFYYNIAEGSTAWSTSSWCIFGTDSNKLIIKGYQKFESGLKPIYGTSYLTSIIDICKKYDIGVQIYGCEPNHEFQELTHVRPDGYIEGITCEYTHDENYNIIKSMPDYGVFENCSTIYNGVIEKCRPITISI